MIVMIYSLVGLQFLVELNLKIEFLGHFIGLSLKNYDLTIKKVGI